MTIPQRGGTARHDALLWRYARAASEFSCYVDANFNGPDLDAPNAQARFFDEVVSRDSRCRSRRRRTDPLISKRKQS